MNWMVILNPKAMMTGSTVEMNGVKVSPMSMGNAQRTLKTHKINLVGWMEVGS